MTEKEFIMSLPQGLTDAQKKERLAKWSQENPQPKKPKKKSRLEIFMK